MTTDNDMRMLAIELICFVQHGKWYNGKVDTKLVDAVAERLMWGPGTAWWQSDRELCRQWMTERKRRQETGLKAAPALPRPLAPPQLPRIPPLPSLPRAPLVAPGLPRPLPLPPLPRR